MAIATVLAAAPAFAQTGTTTPPAAVRAPAPKQQGLGIFVQGGYVYTTISGDAVNFSPQGVLAGIGFGGNKSGTFGVGVDIN